MANGSITRPIPCTSSPADLGRICGCLPGELRRAAVSWVRVDPADLATSSVIVQGHAEDLQIGHGAANTRTAAAQPGLMGLSAAVIEAKVAQWQAVTEVLCARLVGHGKARAGSATGFAVTEDHNMQAVASVGQSEPGPLAE
jgi:hypothetical protein